MASNCSWMAAWLKSEASVTKAAQSKREDRTMTKNEQIVRKGYEIAERQDAEGFIVTFTPDGAFINETLGTSYQGRDVAIPLMIFAKAFPDMHRDTYPRTRTSLSSRAP